MKDMLQLILKYWLEFLLGVIATGLSFACKKFYDLYKAEKAHKQEKEHNKFENELKKIISDNAQDSIDGDDNLQKQICALKDGVLSLQGRNFKQDCRNLLQEDHTITLEEFEALQAEHNTYKSLGGNHDGDELFEMARKKAMRDITQ